MQAIPQRLLCSIFKFLPTHEVFDAGSVCHAFATAVRLPQCYEVCRLSASPASSAAVAVLRHSDWTADNAPTTAGFLQLLGSLTQLWSLALPAWFLVKHPTEQKESLKFLLEKNPGLTSAYPSALLRLPSRLS